MTAHRPLPSFFTPSMNLACSSTVHGLLLDLTMKCLCAVCRSDDERLRDTPRNIYKKKPIMNYNRIWIYPYAFLVCIPDLLFDLLRISRNFAINVWEESQLMILEEDALASLSDAETDAEDESSSETYDPGSDKED